MRGVAAVLLLVALAAPAAAQVCAPPVVTPEVDRLFLRPGADEPLRVAVENRNDVPARATIVAEAPPGWSATPANPSPLLGASVGALTVLHVAAPERGTGVTRGDVVVLVELHCEGMRVPSTATATVFVSVTPIPPAFVAWLVALGVLAVGALVVAGMASRLAGVGLVSPEPELGVEPAGVASFRVLVANKRTVAEVVTLAVGPPPAGWSAVPAAPELHLDPREEKEVWIAVRAPADAEVGTRVDVVVHAALKAEPRRASAVVLRARVADAAG